MQVVVANSKYTPSAGACCLSILQSSLHSLCGEPRSNLLLLASTGSSSARIPAFLLLWHNKFMLLHLIFSVTQTLKAVRSMLMLIVFDPLRALCWHQQKPASVDEDLHKAHADLKTQRCAGAACCKKVSAAWREKKCCWNRLDRWGHCHQVEATFWGWFLTQSSVSCT